MFLMNVRLTLLSAKDGNILITFELKGITVEAPVFCKTNDSSYIGKIFLTTQRRAEVTWEWNEKPELKENKTIGSFAAENTLWQVNSGKTVWG